MLAARSPRDEEASRRSSASAVARRDRDGRPGGAAARAVGRALGRARRRRRPLRGRTLRVLVDLVLLRGGARPRRRGRARDREPRALLRRPRPRAAGVSFPSTTPWSSTRPTGSRRRPRLARRAVSRAGLQRLAADVERACREADEPVPGARARPRRACGRSPAPRRRSRRRAAGGFASLPPTSCSSLVDALAALARRRCRARRRARPACAPHARRGGRAGRGVPRAGDELDRVVWAEPDAIAWAPVDVSRRAARAALGRRPDRDPRLGDADDAARTRVRPRSARARARPASSSSARRSTSASRRCSTCRAICPTRAPTGSRARRGGGGRAALRSPRAARSCSRSSYRALDGGRRQASVGASPYEVLVQGEAPRERLLERFRDEVDSVLLATVDVLAGRRRPGRVALAARDRQASVLSPRRPAPRGAVRGGRGRRRRLVHRLRAAVRSAPAPAGIRPADPDAHGDRGVVAILDPRIRTRAYGQAFFASLPPCRVVESREDVRRFLDAEAAVAS